MNACGFDKLASKDAGIRPAAPTYFAPAERATPRELAQTIDNVLNNPVWQTALPLLGGWVALLNEHRQVVSVNHALLRSLGVDNPDAVLGLRPGEILRCAHAGDHVGGCGTSEACLSCGAAIAIVAAQKKRGTVQRKCALALSAEGGRSDRVFDVRCSPLCGQEGRLLVLCMRDISAEERRQALERTFLHDIGTTVTALAGASDLLTPERLVKQPELLELVRETADSLVHEIKVQKLLCRQDPADLEVTEERPSRLMKRVQAILSSHPAAEGQSLVIDPPRPDRPLHIDTGLLTRVLVNMVVNGLEAGRAGDTVRLWSEEMEDEVAFFVWSRRPIPDRIATRVFQRHFSTKRGDGRGTGTYAMKLIGESLLQGRVQFTSSEAEGTTFRVSVPRRNTAKGGSAGVGSRVPRCG